MDSGEGSGGSGGIDDRGCDASGADGELPVVVPDDASSLEADRLALLRELRRKRALDRLHRTRSGRVRPVNLLLTLALALTTTLAALAVLVLPARSGTVPLATGVPADGRPGSLLPEGTLSTRLGPLPLHDLRPAVVLAAPAGCECVELLTGLLRSTTAVGVDLWLAMTPSDDGGEAAEAAALEASAHLAEVPPGSVRPALDGGRALLPGGSTGPVTYLVGADGVLVRVLDEQQLVQVLASERLDVELAGLTRPLAEALGPVAPTSARSGPAD